MSADTFVLRSFDIEQDCEKLAEMWRHSDAEWPGTWSEGVPMTARQIRTWHERMHILDVFVWETGDRIAGYCSLKESEDEPHMIYLPLLNVSPQFQGHSLGRKFLTHCVNRVVELKKTRLDLDTWSGNLKAVPLYKKTGFFWKPGPNIAMLNFMPGILQMPCARSFFEKHDWYATLQRELTQEPDDERWEGMHVFTYRFAGGEDRLTVRADREAHTITAIETETFSVAAFVDDINPVRGFPTTMRWRLTNHQDVPVEVMLLARGTADLALEYRVTRQIGPGGSVDWEAPVKISETAATPGKDKPATAITSQFLIDGQSVELATGIRPRETMEMSVYPEYITLLPGTPQTVHLRFRSHFARNAEVAISLGLPDGLTANWSQQTVTLPAQGHAGLKVMLNAIRDGVFELPVTTRCRVEGKTISLPADTRTVFALPLGGVLSTRTDGAVRIENETIRLVMDASGGAVSITDPVTGEKLVRQGARPIPPNWPSEFSDKDYALKLDREGDTIVATATLHAKQHPGFVFRKTVRMNAGSMISIDHDFENIGLDPYTFRLYQYVENNHRDGSYLTIPFRDGLIRGHCQTFPGRIDEAFEKAPLYAEQWAAYEFPRATVGVFWPDDGEEINWNGEFGLVTRPYACAPQSHHRPGRLHLYLGSGDWRDVQRVWRRIRGVKNDAFEPLREPVGALNARIEPPVLATVEDRTMTTLRMTHPVSVKCSGDATLILPEGWHSEETVFPFTDLNWQQPFERTIDLTNTVAPGAYTGRLEVRSPGHDANFDIPLLRLGDGGAVAVQTHETEGHRVWTIANGRLEIDVVPTFSATVSAIRADGVNHLACAFPHPEAVGWLYPWHGGIMPMIPLSSELYPGIIRTETFEADQVIHTDRHGMTWHGIRQRSILTHNDVRGLTLELDTLTTGNSPVIKQVLRLENTTSSIRQLEAGWIAFVQPDGDRRQTVLFSKDHEQKRGVRMPSIQSGHWVAAENPETGRTIALVSPVPQTAMDDWGVDGGHLKLRPRHTIEPHETIEVVAYVVVADNREAVYGFTALKDM